MANAPPRRRGRGQTVTLRRGTTPGVSLRGTRAREHVALSNQHIPPRKSAPANCRPDTAQPHAPPVPHPWFRPLPPPTLVPHPRFRFPFHTRGPHPWFRPRFHPWFRTPGSAPRQPPGFRTPGSAPRVPHPGFRTPGSAPRVPHPGSPLNDRSARLKTVRTQNVPHQPHQSHLSQECVHNGRCAPPK